MEKASSGGKNKTTAERLHFDSGVVEHKTLQEHVECARVVVYLNIDKRAVQVDGLAVGGLGTD